MRPSYRSHYMSCSIGINVKQAGSLMKCGSGEGWRKSVGRTRRQMRKCYTWSKKISCKHQEILSMVQEDWKILNTIWYRKHKWMGHMLRHDRILCDILEGRMLGKSTRGKRRIQLLIRNKELCRRTAAYLVGTQHLGIGIGRPLLVQIISTGTDTA